MSRPPLASTSSSLTSRFFAFLRRKLPPDKKVFGVSVDQLLTRASNETADLKSRLVRSRWIRQGEKRPHARSYTPVLTEAERIKLQKQLKVMELRWAEERMLQAVEKEREEQEGAGADGDVNEDTKKGLEEGYGKVLTLDDVTIEELSQLSQTVSKKAQALELQLRKENRKSPLEVAKESVNLLTSLAPQVPFYLATLAQNFLYNKEKQKKKMVSRGERELDDEFQAVSPAASAGPAASKDASSSEGPHWKRMLGTSKASKTTVDARTRFCVNGLRNVVANDSRCLRRLEMLCAHLHQYPYAKGVAVREGAVAELLHIRHWTKNESVQVQVREGLDLLGYHDPPPGRGIRILSLDGGGMRGMVALEVLGAIERTTGKKIHELFDFICGVSTGSIIAAFLSFHKRTVKEVEDTYDRLGFKVFSQDVFHGASGWVLSHSYYDTARFEQTLKDFVGEMKMSDTVRSAGTPKTAIVSTLVSGHRIMPYVFRNYQYPYRTQSFYRGSARYAIWEAIRASSAAPGYFDEFHLNGKIHHDGGIMTNNACIIAIHEAQKLWPRERLQCVVSLGMGRHERPITFEEELAKMNKPKALSLAQKFSRVVDAATDTEISHVTLHDLLPGSVYYRFNPFMSEYFPLDEVRAEKIAAMRSDTRMYLRRNHNRVVELCQQLTLPRRKTDLARDLYNHAMTIGKVNM